MKIFGKIPPLYTGPLNRKKNFWKNFENFLYLYSMTNRVIDTYVKNFSTYYHDGWYWVIIPSTNEWVVSVGKTGYIFFNSKFWSDFSMFYPVEDLTKTVQDWVIYKLDTPISKHCYPDFVNDDYDWTHEFNVTEVINEGELISFCKHDPPILN